MKSLNNMHVYLSNKRILKISNNASQFLQGLTSNKLDSSQNAFCNIHGRIVVTFEQLQIEDGVFLILIEKVFVSDMLSHTERYAKLSGVKIEEVDFNVYYDLDNNVLLEKDDLCIPFDQWKIILTSRQIKTNVSDEDFTRFRLDHFIPRQGVDYTNEMILNVSETMFVSFTKGCFLGQEPISKVYNRSKPSWKLVVKYEEECTSEEAGKMTSKVVNLVNNKTQGFVFERNE